MSQFSVSPNPVWTNIHYHLLLRFATLSVDDGDKGGGEGGETSKRQKRGGKGMVKVKKKEADSTEKKIQGLSHCGKTAFIIGYLLGFLRAAFNSYRLVLAKEVLANIVKLLNTRSHLCQCNNDL